MKPGYARNYLLPQNKALRATDANIAYFETQKSALEKLNAEKKTAAETKAKSFKDMTITLIRQAGETGQLYGSISGRDIADTINEEGKEKIERNMVELNQNFKEIGLFPVSISLHPEVKVEITVNIARTEDEAKTQAKTGKALISDDGQDNQPVDGASEEAKAELMEADALEAEKEAEAKAAEKAAEDEAKATAKAEAKAAKKAAAEAQEEPEEVEAAEEGEAASASAEEEKPEEAKA